MKLFKKKDVIPTRHSRELLKTPIVQDPQLTVGPIEGSFQFVRNVKEPPAQKDTTVTQDADGMKHKHFAHFKQVNDPREASWKKISKSKEE